MRRRNEVIQCEKWRFCIRLLFEDIEGSTRNLSTHQRVVEIVFADDPASGAVDQAHSVLHSRDRISIDQISCDIAEGDMDGDKVGLLEDMIEINQFQTHGEMSI